jgi:hypothetical protein
MFPICSNIGHAQAALVRPRNGPMSVHGCALDGTAPMTRAGRVRMTVPGSAALVEAIMTAIDDYAERETGNREYFWNRPHSVG